MTSLGSSCSSFLLLLFLLSCVFADDAITTTTTTIVPEDDVQTEEAIGDSLAEEMRDQATMTVQKSSSSLKIAATNNSASRALSTFTPSVHLGPIASSDQQRQTTKLSPFNVGPLLFPDEYKNSPFNGLSAIKFGDGKGPPPPKSSSPNPTKLEKIPQQKPFRPSERDENFVKFIDDKEQSKEDCGPASKIGNQRQSEPIYQQHVYVPTESSHNAQAAAAAAAYSEEESYDPSGRHQQYAHYEAKPTKYDTTSAYYTVSYPQAAVQQSQSAHVEPYHHSHEAAIMKPEMVINFQHPVTFQGATYEPVQKPKTVIYVAQEPQHHPFYHQPPPTFNQLEVAEHEEIYPIYYDHPHHRTISPWRKILKIIGAFIPLGLLLALLPNVLNPNTTPNNNNNPSIVLSKLRQVNDLTPEHKHHDALDTECREERSICRLLAAADNAGFDFLRNLVIRITEKTADSSVRKKELDRIFEAARLGNCDIFTCDFYDGT